MAAQFIGAGPGSARRRRRLILSADGTDERGLRPSRRLSVDPASAELAPLERTRVVTRINSLIRPQPWFSWILVAVAFAAWVGVVWSGWAIDRGESGLREVLGLRAGHACRLFGITALLAVTQLSLIILWYRIQSRKDFHGRYRIWIWSTVTWVLFFGGAVFGWHEMVAQWVTARLPSRLQGISDLLWMLPAIAISGASFRLLSKEMTRTPVDRWLLRAAALTGCVSAVLRLAPWLAARSVQLEISHSIASLWPLLLASALLHHARYVIHVTNEVSPPSRRSGRLSPIVQQVWEEVMSLGPSRGRLAEAFSRERLRIYASSSRRIVSRTWQGMCSLMKRVSARVVPTPKPTEVESPEVSQRRPDLVHDSAASNEPRDRTQKKVATQKSKAA